MYGRSVALSYPDPELTDDVVRLRRWRETDMDCVRQAATDPRIPCATTVPAVFSPAAALGFIHRQWARAEDGEGISLAIAAAAGDEAVGLVWLAVRPQPGVVGLGYWIVPDARGRGFGARAARLAAQWALDGAGMARVEAWVEPDNVTSQRLLESAGFAREGVLRSFLFYEERRADAIAFSRTTADHSAHSG
jgi:ribosomal-protein-alanine N-acetyltransferase